jgi:hypothetical protein
MQFAAGFAGCKLHHYPSAASPGTPQLLREILQVLRSIAEGH